MQKLSFYSVILLLVLLIVNQINLVNQLNVVEPLYINDKESEGVSLHGHVDLTKDAATKLSKAISAVGSNIGLGGTMVGVGTAVDKTIVKSGMPPLQRGGVVIAGSVLGGIAHSATSINSRNQALSSAVESKDSKAVNEISNNVSKFINDDSYTPLESILFDIQSASITCLALIDILVIQLIFKLHTKDNIKLKLSNFFRCKFKSKTRKLY